MPPRSPWVLLVVIGALFLAGHYVRSELGVDLGAEPLRDWVRSLGVVAPVVYIGLVAFRQFLFVPSTLLLAAGGLVFGAALGTLLGGVGIVLSALLGFTLARTLGREWLRLRMGDRLEISRSRRARSSALAERNPSSSIAAPPWPDPG